MKQDVKGSVRTLTVAAACRALENRWLEGSSSREQREYATSVPLGGEPMRYFEGLESDKAASQARDTSAFRFANFEIDVARQELRRGSDLIRIEPQVFDLLVYLVRNRNRIVSREELIDAVWKGRVISEATLSSRVSAVRRVIGDNGNDQSLIRTHHKRGFRFIADVKDPVRPCGMPATATAEDSENRAQDAATALRPVLALPDKPSIAVLPFQNRSGDPVQEYFADGLTEDIITGLSRQRWFFVIARNSSFAFKADAVDVRKVASELGVRYV